jgi:hypothetical protein
MEPKLHCTLKFPKQVMRLESWPAESVIIFSGVWERRSFSGRLKVVGNKLKWCNINNDHADININDDDDDV